MSGSAVPRTWRGSSRSQRDEQRRARLLDAALEGFSATGYQGSTVTGICSHARVSTRSFYELFAGREDLLAALYLQICEELLGRIDSLGAPHGDDLMAWLRRSVHQVLAPLLADARTIRILEIEMVGASPALEELRRRTTRRITDALGRWYAVATGRGDPATAQVLAVFVEGGMSELLVAHARGELHGEPSVDQLVGRIADLIALLLAA